MIRTAVAAAALSALAGGAASGEDLVTAPEFEAMSTGRTLHFSRDGARYGAEQYLPGREVIWQYADGSCAHGAWFARGPALCFVYEGDPLPQCWVFARREGDFFARVEGLAAGDPTELQLSGISTAPLACAGPDLGV